MKDMTDKVFWSKFRGGQNGYNQIKEIGNILMGKLSNLQLIFQYFFEKIKI